jgi:hypothetical protein
VGNVLMKNKLDDLVAGRGEKEDLDYLQQLGATVKLTSRCGLGQTSPNLVLNTIAAFRPAYEALVKPKEYAELHASFDIHAALKEAKELAGRDSEIYDARGERTGEHR